MSLTGSRTLIRRSAEQCEPYTYLVDVLQRINQHPAQRVIELTPRI